MKNNHGSVGVGVVSCLLLVAGCSASPTYEADYSYEVLKKAADGSVEIVGTGKSERTAEGDTGGSDFQGIGIIRTGARKVGQDTATILVNYPDQTNGTLELRRRET